MRTDDEILARIEEVKDRDWMGTERTDLMSALSWDAVQPFLSDEGRAKGPEAWIRQDDDKVVGQIHGYLPFAIGKAEDHRGLSAGRSIDHFRAWVWLLGDNTYASIDWDDYPQYGAPILRQIAALVGYAWPTGSEINNMAEGRSCRTGCYSGCGD